MNTKEELTDYLNWLEKAYRLYLIEKQPLVKWGKQTMGRNERVKFFISKFKAEIGKVENRLRTEYGVY